MVCKQIVDNGLFPGELGDVGPGGGVDPSEDAQLRIGLLHRREMRCKRRRRGCDSVGGSGDGDGLDAGLAGVDERRVPPQSEPVDGRGVSVAIRVSRRLVRIARLANGFFDDAAHRLDSLVGDGGDIDDGAGVGGDDVVLVVDGDGDADVAEVVGGVAAAGEDEVAGLDGFGLGVDGASVAGLGGGVVGESDADGAVGGGDEPGAVEGVGSFGTPT